MKDFFELRENKDKFIVKYSMSKKGPIRQMPFHLLVYAKKFLADKEKEGYKGIISKGGKPVKESVELDEAVSKVKTTMPDKVASSATRFGLKSKAQGGHVSISGPKGKLNDFLRAIIGRSSYGNASELSESVEEAYRKPTQAEIDADRRKDGKGKDTSSRYKNIKKKMYGNAMGGLKKEESVVDEAKLSDMGIHNKIADRNLLIKAIKTAEKMGGNMTGAVREIEKMKKGLSKHKAVQAALRQANESVSSADKKPQNFRDPETGKTKVRMVPVDRDIASQKANESVELDEAVRERPFKGHDWGNKDGMLMHTGKKLRKNPKLKGGVKKLYVHHSTKLSVIAVTDDKKSVELIKGVPDGFTGRVDVFNDIATLAYHYGLKPLKPGDKHTEFTASGVKTNESVEIAENYRTLATHGMGTETKNSINVGRDVDYYEPKNGDKRQGRITKVTRSGYVVKDEDSGKSHAFAFHDRAKAKEIMAKEK